MINDKTAWFAFLHSLADIIRNGKSKFTGHDALNEMNNLLLLRFIQHRIGNYNNDGIFIPNKNKESLFSFSMLKSITYSTCSKTLSIESSEFLGKTI